ncbi:SDR family oxidoreductase [Emticicia sp. BO119]|uniref:SDR family oxidoreductase n=1 Tax=Emticicia sp. BO119 TaxID=2757768 RepID=UPI0015F03A55|nr:SDR family NAD(P)-dependent oxidoreductase [Emticicia sp. BO119]MBA4852195.1 SDR family NAD(P)-dependent oxidoreductase [Emticicia sp. BO119]
MLTNNTILITGGSSGVGLELAKRLAEKNNSVLICGRSKEKLEEAKRQLPEVQVFRCDISSERECILLIEWVETNYPECNILINNAAIVSNTEFLKDDKAIEKANNEFQTNILAPIRLSKLFLPLLLNNPDAQIINISTGLVYAPRAVYPFYNATKAALHSFTQTLRLQLINQPIKIIEVLLPVVDTPWHKGNPPKIAIPAEKAVAEVLKELEKKNSLEIRIGGVKILYWLSRIAPGFAIRKINSLGDK